MSYEAMKGLMEANRGDTMTWPTTQSVLNWLEKESLRQAHIDMDWAMALSQAMLDCWKITHGGKL